MESGVHSDTNIGRSRNNIVHQLKCWVGHPDKLIGWHEEIWFNRTVKLPIHVITATKWCELKFGLDINTADQIDIGYRLLRQP